VPVFGRAQGMPDAKTVGNQVRDEFVHAWNGYKQFAWGFDEVLPVSGAPSDFFVKGHSFGLSIIEALDTLYVMELDDDLNACVKWLRTNLNFDVDGNVQMFEAVIRMVAGLIAGYYATGERFMLDGARDLADRLLVCFTKSPTGAPYRYANLHTGAVSDPKSNLAEIGSICRPRCTRIRRSSANAPRSTCSVRISTSSKVSTPIQSTSHPTSRQIRSTNISGAAGRCSISNNLTRGIAC
jgi:hypothetical protein